tara:strand:+ start:1530 stop:2108 length:579 start_codon:yes stop_codon:yes gene_type:complete
MIKINKVYTGAGDKGRTRLGDGSLTPKHSIRVDAYGNIDEANSAVGLVISELRDNSEHDELVVFLMRVQSDLFDLGADLCKPIMERNTENNRISITEEQVKSLENKIDEYNASLDTLNSFILPGGKYSAAQSHLARTIIRRAERSITKLSEDEPINPYIIKYINRLSDLFFVIARILNNSGKNDVLWEPKKK